MSHSERGFSFLEALMVIAMGLILVGAAVPLMSSAISLSDADSAAQLIAQELSYARALAVSSRVNVLVQVLPATDLLVVAPGSGSARGPFSLPANIEFQPTAFSPDTPDGLGSTILGAGSNRDMTFLNNGSVVFDPVQNNIVSGTFFLQHSNNDPATRRAVTLMGGTGRVHIWRYDETTSSWK